MPGEFRGKELLPTGDFYYGISTIVLETAVSETQADRRGEAKSSWLSRVPAARPPEGVYKAAPRDGVWATPPFMHNGSVPNLYEMLVPAKERTKKFYIGREFDPVKVGLDTTARPGSSCWIPNCLETRMPVTPSRTARAETASSGRC